MLASRGQNGDCHIVDSDSGTYEQKVLMFQDVFDDELLQAVSKMLKDYSEDWSVLFLDTDENGAEVPFGIRVDRIAFQLVRPPPTPKELVDWKTTEDLFDRLVPLFAAHGTDNALGKGETTGSLTTGGPLSLTRSMSTISSC